MSRMLALVPLFIAPAHALAGSQSSEGTPDELLARCDQVEIVRSIADNSIRAIFEQTDLQIAGLEALYVEGSRQLVFREAGEGHGFSLVITTDHGTPSGFSGQLRVGHPEIDTPVWCTFFNSVLIPTP